MFRWQDRTKYELLEHVSTVFMSTVDRNTPLICKDTTQPGVHNATEEAAITKLLDDPEYIDCKQSSGLLTTLLAPQDEDRLGVSAQGNRFSVWNDGPAEGPSHSATVRWNISEAESEGASVDSRLSTFSMHLARYDAA
jgi:hypothetical protein